MRKDHILFVVNPKAGDTDKSNLKHLISQACEQKTQPFSIYETTGQNDSDAIKDKLSDGNINIVVACGGDGTVNMVAKIIMNTSVALGIIPLGSANGLAHDLKIPEDVEESLKIIIDGKPQALDIIEINKDQISLHLSDIGFNAKMIQEFESSGERGMSSYAKAFFSVLSDRESIKFKIKLDDETIETEAEMLVLANAYSYGTGAVINPESSMQDGYFEVLVFKPIPVIDLPELTFETFFGTIKNSPYVDIYRTKAATITSEGKHLLQMDGEVIGEVDHVDVVVHYEAIEVMLR